MAILHGIRHGVPETGGDLGFVKAAGQRRLCAQQALAQVPVIQDGRQPLAQRLGIVRREQRLRLRDQFFVGVAGGGNNRGPAHGGLRHRQ